MPCYDPRAHYVGNAQTSPCHMGAGEPYDITASLECQALFWFDGLVPT